MPKGKRDVLKNDAAGMRRALSHVKRKTDVLLKLILFLLILLCLNTANAQDFDTVVAVVEPPTSQDKENIVFDKIPRNYVPTLNKREVSEQALTQLQQDEDFWYANKDFKKKETKKATSSNFFGELFREKWIKTLLWILIIISFTAIIIWYLLSLNIRLFRKAPTSIQALETDKMPEDIFSIPYDKSIADALKQNNYRLAVRLHYLQTLMHRSQKNLIHFKQDKSNSQYLAQLYNSEHYNEFFKLTRRFEYTWYGQFSLSTEAFEQVQKDFKTFNLKLV